MRIVILFFFFATVVKSQNLRSLELIYDEVSPKAYDVLDSILQKSKLDYIAFGETHFHKSNKHNIRWVSEYMIKRHNTQFLAFEISPIEYFFWEYYYMNNNDSITKFFFDEKIFKDNFETLKYLKTKYPDIQLVPIDLSLDSKGNARALKFILLNILEQNEYSSSIPLIKLYDDLVHSESKREVLKTCFKFRKHGFKNNKPLFKLKDQTDSTYFFSILYSYTYHKRMKFPKVVFNKRLSRIREQYILSEASKIMNKSNNAPVAFFNGVQHIAKKEGLWFGEKSKSFISELEDQGKSGVSILNYYKGEYLPEKKNRYHLNYINRNDVIPYLNKDSNYLLVFEMGYYKMFDWVIINN